MFWIVDLPESRFGVILFVRDHVTAFWVVDLASTVRGMWCLGMPRLQNLSKFRFYPPNSMTKSEAKVGLHSGKTKVF